MKTGSLGLYFALVLPEEYSFMFNICITVRYMYCLSGRLAVLCQARGFCFENPWVGKLLCV